MTTTSPVPQTDSPIPWLDDDHWQAGDSAWWIYVTDDFTDQTAIEIVSPEEGTVTVHDPDVTDADGVFEVPGKFENIRHRGFSCTPCGDSVLELLAAGQDAWACYWSRWSPDAHDRFDELKEAIQWRSVDGELTGTFSPDAYVPNWLREVTAGHLLPSESRSLSVARVREPIDWPTLITDHPGDLPVLIGEGWTQPQLTEILLIQVFRKIAAAGLAPYLHVMLDIDMNGVLRLLPAEVGTKSGIGQHPDLVSSVTAALGTEMETRGPEGFWVLHPGMPPLTPLPLPLIERPS